MKAKKLKDLISNNEIKREEASKIKGGITLTIEEALLASGGHQQMQKVTLTIEEALLASGGHQQMIVSQRKLP